MYVPSFVENSNQKNDQFLRALKPIIKSFVRMSTIGTYEELVDRTMIAEEDKKDIMKDIQ